MRIAFRGDLEGLLPGIDAIAGDLGFTVAADGVPVTVGRSPHELEVTLDGAGGRILHARRIHFFRGLARLVEAHEHGETLHLEEAPRFDSVGPMFDCSRNGVLTSGSLRRMLRRMAAMGLDRMLLYMEDTYEVEGEPFFGYLRGRYRREDLEACDAYAERFGIEIVPCIQTLGHLGSVLDWPAYRDLQDNVEVLLAGDERVYDLLERMIASASAPFRSKRIHLGMDEAWGMGLGRYLDRHGPTDRFALFSDHLERVVDIARQHGLQPMIWSDMYFRVGSKTHGYYDLDAELPEDVVRRIPKDVDFVYWDYYHRDEDFYRAFIAKHRTLGRTPIFAGGILGWGSFCTNYERTVEDAGAALRACKAEGVREVIVTLWQDDGAESDPFAGLLGLQLYAEHAYDAEPDPDALARTVEFTTGIGFDAYMALSGLDMVPGVDRENRWPPNASKYLLWQDPLLGLFDADVAGLGLPEHYARLEATLREAAESHPDAEPIFRVPQALCAVLKGKCDVGLRLKGHYDRDEREALGRIATDELPDLEARVRDLQEAHRERWFAIFEPFGWEALELRYGGLASRLRTTAARVRDFTHGSVDRLPELEEERLPLDRTEKGLGTGFWKRYQDVATPAVTHQNVWVTGRAPSRAK